MLNADAELRETPVFLLTAKGQDADKQIGLQCGASMYITKPFSMEEICKAVDAALAA
jgi:two-component system phosphate regulon response regulator PhoB